jgi:hydrogenase/urease accessory protein HupE
LKSATKTRPCRLIVFLTACLGSFLIPGLARAHDARPLSVMIAERQQHVYFVEVRIPPSVEPDNWPSVSWPVGCSVRPGGIQDAAGEGLETMLVSCPAGLEGQRIGVQYKLYNPSLSTLFRLSSPSGTSRTAVVPPDQTAWLIPAATNWRDVARDYFVLGVKHIWSGIDHLLFVAGLLLLAGTPRRVAVAITGFTMAHSVTLSLSALGIVRLPVAPIEAGIALSILFLAREIARPNSKSLARRFPVLVSSSFGLLHGFGFAAALNEVGIPSHEIAPALLFFNAGVEAGQLVFIACVCALIAVAYGAARLVGMQPVRSALVRVEVLGAYAIGVPAAFWLLQRLQNFR